MRRQTRNTILEWVSIASLIAGVALSVIQLVAYSRGREKMPLGLQIAGVPVGGLNRIEALEQLANAYATPVELHYEDQVIVLDPSAISFRLDTETMLAAGDTYRSSTAFWPGFWDYLWRRPGEEHTVALRYEYSTSQLQQFLEDIAARYDEPPTAAQPIPGTVEFKPGSPGYTLDVEPSLKAIETALQMPQNRRVALVINRGDEGRPTLETLGVLIRQQIELHQFRGLASIVVIDLLNGKELHMNYRQGEDLPTEPDVAFSATSIMKTAIMVSFYRDLDRGGFPYETELVKNMIQQSSNYAPNALLDWLGDNNRRAGLERVNDLLRTAGLANSWMGGWYEQESPPEPQVTPANSRTDISTDPDPYMQLTVSDMATLFMDLYQCARGGGAFEAAFPGKLTAGECNTMLDYLAGNKIGVLIEAGVPEGIRVAHKHGWIGEPLTNVGDVGIVFSPGGDYVLGVMLYEHEDQGGTPWDETSKLITALSRAVYNYYNQPVTGN